MDKIASAVLAGFLGVNQELIESFLKVIKVVVDSGKNDINFTVNLTLLYAYIHDAKTINDKVKVITDFIEKWGVGYEI